MFSVKDEKADAKLFRSDFVNMYTTSDQSIWAALRSRDVHPYKVDLTDISISVSYDSRQMAPLISKILGNQITMDEFSAHGSMNIWKSIIAIMKMLEKYENDKNHPTDPGRKCVAFTSDQHLMNALAYRNIDASNTITVNSDKVLIYEFDEAKCQEIKEILFSSCTGDLSDHIRMRGIWRKIKNLGRRQA